MLQIQVGVPEILDARFSLPDLIAGILAVHFYFALQ